MQCTAMQCNAMQCRTSDPQSWHPSFQHPTLGKDVFGPSKGHFTENWPLFWLRGGISEGKLAPFLGLSGILSGASPLPNIQHATPPSTNAQTTTIIKSFLMVPMMKITISRNLKLIRYRKHHNPEIFCQTSDLQIIN